MLKGLRNVVMLGMVGLALCGCRSLHRFTQSCNTDTDRYLQATNVAPIKVPMGVDPPETRSALQIPVLNEPAPPKFTEPRGPRPPPAV